MSGGAAVFAYGSLAGWSGRPAILRGYRRVWGVAMDNRLTIPGYKVYEHPTGERPAVEVAFLDLVPDPEGAVNGVLVEADEETLAALDLRERQYRRVEVAGAIEVEGRRPATVWTYIGRDEGRARVKRGRSAGTVVIHKAYRDFVEEGFAAEGPHALSQFLASTEPPPFPVRELRRVDL